MPALDRRFLKFLVVGGVNTLFGYSIFALLTYAGLVPPLAIFLSTTAAVAFNFRTMGGLVFGNRDRRLIFRFGAVYVIMYGLNVLTLEGVMLGFGLGVYPASALLILPLAVVSFLLNKAFVFTAKPPPQPPEVS